MSGRADLSSNLFLIAPAPTEISTLSLHNALPISLSAEGIAGIEALLAQPLAGAAELGLSEREQREALLVVTASYEYQDRKSTRLNSSHGYISYAVFCLKQKYEDTASARQCHVRRT